MFLQNRLFTGPRAIDNLTSSEITGGCAVLGAFSKRPWTKEASVHQDVRCRISTGSTRYILRTISPDHLPSRFRRGTSLGLGSPHIAAAPASDRAAHLGQHLPRTARPRASSLARAESGRARGAPDARGGPTAAHDIKGTPTIFPSHRTLRAHTYCPVGGGDRGDRLGSRLVVWAYTLLWCCSQVKSIHKQQTTIRKPFDLT
jgi:hypothetical protein